MGKGMESVERMSGYVMISRKAPLQFLFGVGALSDRRVAVTGAVLRTQRGQAGRSLGRVGGFGTATGRPRELEHVLPRAGATHSGRRSRNSGRLAAWKVTELLLKSHKSSLPSSPASLALRGVDEPLSRARGITGFANIGMLRSVFSRT